MQQMVSRLDDLGRPAWIALMVLGFILFWPLGLGILAYLIWSGRMSCGRREGMDRWPHKAFDRWERKMQRWGRGGSSTFGATSGNAAFDEYREATLKRLYEEQRDFQDFLGRLRMAKDRAEFDQFMTERRSGPQPGSGPAGPAPQPQQG